MALGTPARTRPAIVSEVTEVLELPWNVIATIADDARGAAIRARGIPVIAREVLRFQPGVDAAAAVQRALNEGEDAGAARG